MTSIATNIGTLFPSMHSSPGPLILGAPGGVGTGGTLMFYDFAISPIDGQIYGVLGGYGGANFGLYRINTTTGNITPLSGIGIGCATCVQFKQYNPDETLVSVSPTVIDADYRFGAAYFDSEGNFFIADNAENPIGNVSITNGRVYRFDAVHTYGVGSNPAVPSTGRTAILVNNQLRGVQSNDGARCPNAIIPCTTVNYSKPVPLTPGCPTGMVHLQHAGRCQQGYQYQGGRGRHVLPFRPPRRYEMLQPGL
mgnify:CR=1 FL=1